MNRTIAKAVALHRVGVFRCPRHGIVTAADAEWHARQLNFPRCEKPWGTYLCHATLERVQWPPKVPLLRRLSLWADQVRWTPFFIP